MILDRKHFDINEKAVFEKILFDHPHRMKAVFGDSACLLYTKNGDSNVYSANEMVSLNANESVLLRCGTYFNEYVKRKVDGPSEVYAIHLHYDILRDIYKNDIPSFLKESKNTEYAVKLANKSVIDHFIGSLDFYFENPELVTPELLSLKIKELILLLLKGRNAQSVADLISDLFSPRQINFKQLVEEHIYSNISVEDLASLGDMSLSSFKRQFKATYNNTPANYLNLKKLEKAESLLRQTDQSVSEICFEVGFEYTTNFAKAFKRKNGISALAYRDKQALSTKPEPNE